MLIIVVLVSEHIYVCKYKDFCVTFGLLGDWRLLSAGMCDSV